MKHRSIWLFAVALIAFPPMPATAVVPLVPAGKTVQIADDVYVIPDQRVPLVPNVGIIVGQAGVMVVDTGMGPRNAQTVLAEVRRITDKPILYLACTHFHPEHNFGAQSFPDETTIIYSIAERRDLESKGEAYRKLFVDLFGDDVRALLEPVVLVPPDVTFERRVEVDLGGRRVVLAHLGRPAHTTGDTVIYLPEEKILFSGGLTPSRFFPIMPDPDSSGEGWIASLEELEDWDVNTVVPGHGEISDARLIGTVKDYLIALRTRVNALAAADKPLEEIKTVLLSEFTEAHPDWDQPSWINNAVENFYKSGPAR